MKILAFDTSTAACSVALYVDEQIFSEHIVQPRGHANLILDMIKTLLGKAGILLADIDYISFGQGPGSFTGLRIAAGVCQGIAYSQNIPVIGLSSLRILAQGAYRETQRDYIAILQDARMSEVYWACFSVDAGIDQNGIMKLMDLEKLSKPDMVQLDNEKSWYCVGEALANYEGKLAISNKMTVNVNFNYPNAIDMIALTKYEVKNNNVTNAENIKPVYLRNQVAFKKQ